MVARIPLVSVVLVLSTAALAGCAGKGGDGVTRVGPQLHSAYADHPFKGGQVTEDHEWSFIDGSRTRISFLHWMPHDGNHDSETAQELFAVGDGFKGKACKGADGVTEEEVSAGYVHFHKESAPTWAQGHGFDNKDQLGYWLRHVAVKGDVEMMGPGKTVPGKVYLMMDNTGILQEC